MKSKIVSVLVVTICIVPLELSAETHGSYSGLKLSQPVLELLREEMREVTVGVQGIAPAIATGDWAFVESTSLKIRKSYIMEKKLTAAQSEELEGALPDQFKRMDAEFHARAEKLGAAAASHDAELAIYHYARMLEGCTQCHARFTPARFPGFVSSAQDGHRH